jgi:hypothetical protein
MKALTGGTLPYVHHMVGIIPSPTGAFCQGAGVVASHYSVFLKPSVIYHLERLLPHGGYACNTRGILPAPRVLSRLH